MKKICLIPGCNDHAVTRGWCRMHYHRWKRTGDPLGLRRVPAKVLLHNGYEIFQHKAVHLLIAERVLGRPLPKGAEVHHANGNKRENTNSNLVICPSRAYHMLLHRRLRAMEATGDPNKRKCVLCKQWDDPANLYFAPSVHAGKHKRCDAIAQSQWAAKKRAKLSQTTHHERKNHGIQEEIHFA